MQLGDKEVLPAASKDGKQKLKPSPSWTHEKATVGLALPGPFKAEGCVCLESSLSGGRLSPAAIWGGPRAREGSCCF